jgi:hypothetical protein
VAVVNDTDSCDVAVSGCAGVVCCGVAAGSAGWGIGTVRHGAGWDVLRVLVDVPASLSGRGGLFWTAICVMALAVGVVIVWVAKSVASGLARVPALKAMFQKSKK